MSVVGFDSGVHTMEHIILLFQDALVFGWSLALRGGRRGSGY